MPENFDKIRFEQRESILGDKFKKIEEIFFAKVEKQIFSFNSDGMRHPPLASSARIYRPSIRENKLKTGSINSGTD